MIKSILFDFDGVLTTDATGSQSICNYICKKTGLDIEMIEREYYRYNDELLYGKTSHENIWDKFCNGIGRKIDIDVLHESFINTPIDTEMMLLVDRLKQRSYKIGMVTDNKKDRIDKIVEYYDWNKVFNAIAISAEVGSGKDNNKIFDKILNKINVNADECVFIDNQKKNLIIPKGMGMKVIYFDHEKRDYEKLIKELKDFEVEL